MVDKDTTLAAIGYVFCKLILRECPRMDIRLLESMGLLMNHTV